MKTLFTLTNDHQEFEDTLAYISKIHHQAESYGICRIVPPVSWIPPCRLKEKDIWEHSKFSTRIQLVDLLQNREPMRKKRSRKRKRKRHSKRTGKANPNSKLEPNSASDCDEKFGFQTGPDFTLADFEKHAADFKECYFGCKDTKSDQRTNVLTESNKRWKPSVEDIEGEYWRIVEQPTDEVEVWIQIFITHFYGLIRDFLEIITGVGVIVYCATDILWG